MACNAVVRTNACAATPYLRRHTACLQESVPVGGVVVDVGAGNGRNMDHVKRVCPASVVVGYDARADRADITQLTLTEYTALPHSDATVSAVLCQYLLMFLAPSERRRLLSEIARVTRPGGIVVVQVFPALRSRTPTPASADRCARDAGKLLAAGGFEYVNRNCRSFIMRKKRT